MLSTILIALSEPDTENHLGGRSIQRPGTEVHTAIDDPPKRTNIWQQFLDLIIKPIPILSESFGHLEELNGRQKTSEFKSPKHKLMRLRKEVALNNLLVALGLS